MLISEDADGGDPVSFFKRIDEALMLLKMNVFPF